MQLQIFHGLGILKVKTTSLYGRSESLDCHVRVLMCMSTRPETSFTIQFSIPT